MAKGRGMAERAHPWPATRPPLRRLFWTMGQLQRGRTFTANDLARRWEVGLRTAYRDIDFIRDSWMAPVEFDRSKHGYVLTEPAFSLPSITLSQGELLGLFFAEKLVSHYRGTPYGPALQSALGKLENLLPDRMRLSPGALDAFLSLDLGPVLPADPEVFAAVVQAITESRRLKVRYKSLSSNHAGDRILEPYRVFNYRGDWYVIAFDDRRKELREFALHRIRRPTLLDEKYQIDPAFRFDKYMADAFGIEKGGKPAEVSIRFAPRQARWIRERKWHRTARIQEALDGSCVLTVKVSGMGEIKRWVMQFGAEAEVLGPKALRREVGKDLRKAAARYRRA